MFKAKIDKNGTEFYNAQYIANEIFGTNIKISRKFLSDFYIIPNVAYGLTNNDRGRKEAQHCIKVVNPKMEQKYLDKIRDTYNIAAAFDHLCPVVRTKDNKVLGFIISPYVAVDKANEFIKDLDEYISLKYDGWNNFYEVIILDPSKSIHLADIALTVIFKRRNI